MRARLLGVLSALLIVVASVALVGGAGAAPASAAVADPVAYPTAPEGDVAGVNDWTCRPSGVRPTPVILVHGTFGDRRHLLERLALAMLRRGYCVFSLDYGNRATGEISASARELKRFADRVLRTTGARKVSLVGHSQGGMMPRYYIRFLGGRQVVRDLVGIAPSNHGTARTEGENPLTVLFGLGCRACLQQGAGSPFLRRLNRGDETPGKVAYTQITTRRDQVVVPHTSGYLEPGPRTTNVTIQDRCPDDSAEHILVPTSRTTIAITLNALHRRGPARKSYDPCP